MGLHFGGDVAGDPATPGAMFDIGDGRQLMARCSGTHQAGRYVLMLVLLVLLLVLLSLPLPLTIVAQAVCASGARHRRQLSGQLVHPADPVGGGL